MTPDELWTELLTVAALLSVSGLLFAVGLWAWHKWGRKGKHDTD